MSTGTAGIQTNKQQLLRRKGGRACIESPNARSDGVPSGALTTAVRFTNKAKAIRRLKIALSTSCSYTSGRKVGLSCLLGIRWRSGPVGGPDGGRWSSLWRGPCGLWSVETRPALYNGLPVSNAWILVARGLVLFCNLCNSQKPGPGSAHTLPTKCGPRCFLAQVVGVRAGPRGNCFRVHSTPINLAF